MKPVYLGLLFIFLSFALFYRCTHKADISGFPEICFAGEVQPIFLSSCARSNCHDGNGESGLILTSYNEIMNGIVAGDPGASPIYKAITSTFGGNLMPPGQPLTKDNRTIIRLWIEQGATDSTCPGVTSKGPAEPVPFMARACYSGDIPTALKGSGAVLMPTKRTSK